MRDTMEASYQRRPVAFQVVFIYGAHHSVLRRRPVHGVDHQHIDLVLSRLHF
jgi:hypothetical protein